MGTVHDENGSVQGTELEQSAEAAVVQAADEAAEQEAEAKAELQVQATRLLGDAAKAFRKGEQEYGRWVLKAGELAWEYVLTRMRLTGMGRKTQEAAYSALEGELNKWASSKVRVDAIVRASMACRLFMPHLPAKVSLPYGHWRDAWCQLVELLPDGTWAIPALVGEDAVAEFKRATEAGMSREESLDVVKGVQRKLARLQAEQAQEAAAEQRQAEQEAKQDALEATAERQAVEDEAKALEEAAKTAADADRTRLTQEAEQKRQELLQAQRAEIEARAKAEAEARETARKAAEAKRATERQVKAEEKAVDREARRQDREAQREAKATGQAIESVQQPGLRAMAKSGTAKDVAGMMVELLTGTDEPDSVFEEFIRQAKASGELSKGSMAACDAALVILTRRSQAA